MIVNAVSSSGVVVTLIIPTLFAYFLACHFTFLMFFKSFSIISCLTAYPEPGRSPQTQYVFTGKTVQLNCSIQPGRARSLYSVEWDRDDTRIVDTTFSIPVAVQNVSQNGTVYQCTVTVQSCSPFSSSSSCRQSRRFVNGNPITLVVGGKYILTILEFSETKSCSCY